jgi:hypothetical protein
MEQDVRSGESERLEKYFRLCATLNLDSELAVGTFFYSIIMNFGVYLESSTLEDVEVMCEKINDVSIVDDLEAVANWVANHFLTELECIDVEIEKIIATFSDQRWDALSTLYGGIQSLNSI